MIKADAFSFIDPGEVEAIIQRSCQNLEYPYQLAIRMRSGYELKISFKTFGSMDKAAERIANLVSISKSDSMLTQDSVRGIVAREVDKLRPYLRRMEKLLRDGDTAGSMDE